MSKENLFERAVRRKYRFPFRGNISIEDLFDLSLTNLDSVFKTLNKESKQLDEESLLSTPTEKDQLLQDMIEIVKYIVGVKQSENKARLEAKDKADKKAKILSLLAKKQDEAMENMSEEELLKQLEEL